MLKQSLERFEATFKVVLEYYELTEENIYRKQQYHIDSIARFMYIYILRNFYKFEIRQIASYKGNRLHEVINIRKKTVEARERFYNDVRFRHEYFNICNILKDREVIVIEEIDDEQMILLKVVCRLFNVTFEQMKMGGRKSEYSYPRMIYCYIASEYLSPAIRNSVLARFFMKNHATVTYAIATIGDFIATNNREVKRDVITVLKHFRNNKQIQKEGIWDLQK